MVAAARTSSRCDFRRLRDRASLREVAAAAVLDEVALARHVKPLLQQQDAAFKASLAKGAPHQEALLQCSRAFQDEYSKLCWSALVERDRALLRCSRTADQLHALRLLGLLSPPWLRWRQGEERRVQREFEAALEESRVNREYELRSRLVRVETSNSYGNSRFAPRALQLPGAVDHVLAAADVARLRAGEALVLDPDPALLPPDAMRSAMDDLLRLARSRSGVVRSVNPCNEGSFHGMLPIDPGSGGAQAREQSGIGASTSALVRKLGALPALIERYGWPRQLAVPAMVQLGFYPGGSGARYRPHLDRWPNEVSNRRELTILVYCNCGWDAARHGGCLRLHPDQGGTAGAADATAAGAAEGVVDVAPTAGRVVIFQSGKQMHEVLESTAGADRVALTLWVEYEGEWREESA